MTEYNGFKSWNAWNVSLWINNDEGLYRLAQDAHQQASRNKLRTARILMRELDGQRTPDGARYNLSSIISALAGF